MFDREIFSNRLKCLRIAHGLSSSQLAVLLNFKSKGSIGNLESGKSAPLTDSLIDIADLFAVSLDWLAGRSPLPYTNAQLTELEADFWSMLSLNINQTGEFALYFPPLPEIYTNIEKRIASYSLEIRANILFLLFVIFLTAMTAKSIDDDNDTLFHPPFSCIPKNERLLQEDAATLLANIEEHSSYLKSLNRKYALPTMQLIEKLFTQEITEPIFDIMSQPIKNRFHGLLP